MKSTIAKRCVLIGVATLAAGLSLGQASAAESDSGAPQVVVRYSDLNLSQPRDARILYGRIQRAARQACDNGAPEDLWLAQKFHACVDHAIANAVAAVSARRVEEIHAARSKFLSRS